MVRHWLGCPAVLALLAAGVPAAAAPAGCAGRLLPGAVVPADHDVTAEGLVDLLDFGRADNSLSGAPPFSISPDGAWAAMAVRRADARTDSYCIGLVVVALSRHRSVRLLDVGGEFMAMTQDVRDAPDIVNGTPAPGTPLWSPDGRHLAYLRRDAKRTQVWIVGLDGNPARRVTHFATDVIGFVWSRDGRAIRAETRPSLTAARATIAEEGRSGFLFDKRFWTLSEDRPRPPLPIPVIASRIDLATGRVDVAPAGDKDGSDPETPLGEVQSGHSGVGNRAWLAPVDPRAVFGPTALHVEVAGKALACPELICRDHVGAFWWISPSALLFLRAGGPAAGGRTTLYRWRVGVDAAPVAVFDTDDALFGCRPVKMTLICARETAVQPRTLVSIGPAFGRVTTLFDPNADFARLEKGRVTRLIWTSDPGVTTYGDLVLPPGHQPGQHHPLVVVQYTSRGFLRGGTGNEVPIHLLAARGFAVLSFQRPALLPGAEKARDLGELQRMNIRDFAERRMIVRALEAGIDAAIATGAVDSTRIGVTGLSDGAVTVQYALSHPNRFAAAAIGTCCDDASTAMFAAGQSYRDAVISWGYPPPEAPDTSFWRSYSLAANADRMRTPLLIQAADSEYRLALETVSTLQHAGAPVEMYVFPDEHHVKSHPAHRLAVYQRIVAWFDFWLRDRRTADPTRQAELMRWSALRTRVEARR